MSHYRAVLFDWVGTLVHYQRGRWRLTKAHASLGREIHHEDFEHLVGSLELAFGDPEVKEAMLTEDCSLELHRSANMLWFDRAGLDSELALALYAMYSDPATYPVYPDSAEVLGQLHARGIRLGVVSDFHMDLRPAIAANDLAGYIDAVVVSSEEGFQKPDTRMFAVALERLGVIAGEALMVGDRVSHDGAAAGVGIDTLILPMPEEVSSRGLQAVLRLVG
ncbi:MAG: HAD-IA family hydrolase [bacterium]|nr:HAD-IA family hydrolase [bacterium]